MIELHATEKIYRRGAEDVHALRGIDLTIPQGEILAISVPSGAGKPPLLHLLGCLDQPTRGEVRIDGTATSQLPEAALVKLRREKIGFIFQQFHLLPGLSLYDNIALPLLFSRRPVERDKIHALAEMVGLQHRLDHPPSQLSGGEMQRTAIARSLVNDPKILLADEPTGNLDSENSDKIFDIMQRLNREGLTIVMITHNPELAARTGWTVQIRDGKIAADSAQAPR